MAGAAHAPPPRADCPRALATLDPNDGNGQARVEGAANGLSWSGVQSACTNRVNMAKLAAGSLVM